MNKQQEDAKINQLYNTLFQKALPKSAFNDMLETCSQLSKMVTLSKQYQILASQRPTGAFSEEKFRAFDALRQNVKDWKEDLTSMAKEASEEMQKKAKGISGSNPDLKLDYLHKISRDFEQEIKDKTKDARDTVKNKVSEKAEEFQQRTREAASKANDTAHDVKEDVKYAKDAVKDKTYKAGEELKTTAQTKAHDVTEEIKDMAHDTKEDLKKKTNDFKEKAENVVENVVESAEDKAYRAKENIKEVTYTTLEKAKDKAYETAEEVKKKANNTAKGAIGKIEEKVHDVTEEIKEMAYNTKEGAKEKVLNVEQNLKSKVEEGVEGIKNKAYNAVERMKETVVGAKPDEKDNDDTKGPQNYNELTGSNVSDAKKDTQHRQDIRKDQLKKSRDVLIAEGKDIESRGRHTLEEVTRGVKGVGDKISESAEAIKSKAAGTIEGAAQSAKDKARDLKEGAVGIVHSVESSVQKSEENPTIKPYLDSSNVTGRTINDRLSSFESLEKTVRREIDDKRMLGKNDLQNKIVQVVDILTEEGSSSPSRFAPCLQSITFVGASLDSQGNQLKKIATGLYGAETCWFDYLAKLQQCQKDKEITSCYKNVKPTELSCITQSKEGLRDLKEVINKN